MADEGDDDLKCGVFASRASHKTPNCVLFLSPPALRIPKVNLESATCIEPGRIHGHNKGHLL